VIYQFSLPSHRFTLLPPYGPKHPRLNYHLSYDKDIIAAFVNNVLGSVSVLNALMFLKRPDDVTELQIRPFFFLEHHILSTMYRLRTFPGRGNKRLFSAIAMHLLEVIGVFQEHRRGFSTGLNSVWVVPPFSPASGTGSLPMYNTSNK